MGEGGVLCGKCRGGSAGRFLPCSALAQQRGVGDKGTAAAAGAGECYLPSPSARIGARSAAALAIGAPPPTRTREGNPPRPPPPQQVCSVRRFATARPRLSRPGAARLPPHPAAPGGDWAEKRGSHKGGGRATTSCVESAGAKAQAAPRGRDKGAGRAHCACAGPARVSASAGPSCKDRSEGGGSLSRPGSSREEVAQNGGWGLLRPILEWAVPGDPTPPPTAVWLEGVTPSIFWVHVRCSTQLLPWVPCPHTPPEHVAGSSLPVPCPTLQGAGVPGGNKNP